MNCGRVPQCRLRAGATVNKFIRHPWSVISPRYYSVVRGRSPFIAIIGSGPAGFYTAQRLMRKLSGTQIDMYEGLAAPFGLSRYGVAPDHPEVKECEKSFEDVAKDPNFKFYGNLSVGSRGVVGGFHGCAVRLSSLLRNYDGIVFAYGSSKDRILGVPGEDMKGVYSAREFVAWYNSHPSFSEIDFPQLREAEEATIIGQGNVALDVARMLLTPVDELRKTDMADYALEALSRSRIRRVHLVGRRGAMQAAFTRKELRELQELYPKAYLQSQHFPADLLPPKVTDRVKKRMLQTFHALREMSPSADPEAKSWSLDFLLSPTSFYGSGSVEGTAFAVNQLSDPFADNAKAIATDESVKIPSQLVFRSIGYKAVPLDGFAELNIGFDTRKGCILNDGMGRVGSTETLDEKPVAIPGLYCVGWAKNGPIGKIVNTFQDANDTAENIIADWKSGSRFLSDSQAEPPQGMSKVQEDIDTNLSDIVSWEDWVRVDTQERLEGQALGKPRVKMVAHKELSQEAKVP
ncbi:hypothetical protein MKZ38_009601 [Zalerion maritima]|uniref:NADPH:adrenodoxin oxidoreductase, mitochondrial n=1 Tax=Zalerion maritima TaxID=339359 RepID=A0AAD5RFW0_9PEZI|nr:hypothetical protein MKZ38_009601 [Zalerion maritima]